MPRHASDPATLRDPFGRADKLRIRSECHVRHSENRGSYLDWLLQFLVPQPDCLLLDVGCGPGTHHPRLRQQQMRIVGVDLSAGMLREVRGQARAAGLRVDAVRGDAARLPLADACCDRVLANHMLYHAPDRLGALREMRRVLRPGGRVVISTYALDSLRPLLALHAAVARELGYVPTPPVFARFHLGDLPLVREVFPEARLKLRPDAFLFRDADAALRYYATGLVDSIEEPPPDGSHRARLLQMIAPEIHKRLERDGLFRVPKTTGCFVAEV